MTNFNTWLDTLISEKDIDLEQMLEVQGDSGLNMIPLQIVIDTIKTAMTAAQKVQFKQMVVNIDFANGDVVD